MSLAQYEDTDMPLLLLESNVAVKELRHKLKDLLNYQQVLKEYRSNVSDEREAERLRNLREITAAISDYRALLALYEESVR